MKSRTSKPEVEEVYYELFWDGKSATKNKIVSDPLFKLMLDGSGRYCNSAHIHAPGFTLEEVASDPKTRELFSHVSRLYFYDGGSAAEQALMWQYP